MEEKLEYKKMRERIDWAVNELTSIAKKFSKPLSDEVIFVQAIEIAKTLFVRSEIAYSSSR